MTILFDATRTVKPATTRRFGVGILPPRGAKPYTQADLDWLTEDNARREENAVFDRLAEESAAMDRLEAGLCC